MLSLLYKLFNSKYTYEEVSNHTFVFKNQQWSSRKMTIEYKPDRQSIKFSRMPNDFLIKWNIGNDHLLKSPLSGEMEDELISDFFAIDIVEPHPEAPPFEDMIIIHSALMDRQCRRFKRDGHYELNYDDLWLQALLRLHECWLYVGNKPIEDFECILSASIWNKFQTLMSKHFQTAKRLVGQLSISMEDIDEPIPDLQTYHENLELKEALKERVQDWDPIEQFLVTEILTPSEEYLKILSMDCVRFNKLQMQGQRKLPKPAGNLRKLATYSNQYSEVQLKSALSTVLSRLGLPARLLGA